MILIQRLIDDAKFLIARSLAAVLPAKFMRNSSFFSIWERRGYHVTPVHFFQPLPDTASLKDSVWTTPDSLEGIDIREEDQVDLLDKMRQQFKPEYCDFPLLEATATHPFYLRKTAFGSVDAEMLYSLVRHIRPRKMIEIGSGWSTMISSLAIARNKAESPNYECRFVAIEPHPRPDLKSRCPHLTTLIDREVQEVSMEEFTSLEENDILFIDSSHISKVGSDVNFELLQIIPRLAPGVFVHIHDIFLPFEYPKKWHMEWRIFFNEQYLVRAFLTFNSSFRIIWAASYMHWKTSRPAIWGVSLLRSVVNTAGQFVDAANVTERSEAAKWLETSLRRWLYPESGHPTCTRCCDCDSATTYFYEIESVPTLEEPCPARRNLRIKAHQNGFDQPSASTRRFLCRGRGIRPSSAGRNAD